MKNKLFCLPLFLFFVLPTGNDLNKLQLPEKTGTIKISFVNTVKAVPLQLRTASYTNPFGEEYTVSKFKYYISHVALAPATGATRENADHYLIDEDKPESLSFSFPVSTGTYTSLSFLPGVDSLHNVSGAQTGALDPLNDMFWTWNTGYIMAKIEGTSPQSKLVNNKVEFHIGGFTGPNSVLQNIRLNFPAGKTLQVQEGKTSEIIIEVDINSWWQQPNDIKIAEHPVCSTPGVLAKKIADNYNKMFTIKDISN